MTITRADVADLQPGDVVEMSDTMWRGTVMRGPLVVSASGRGLALGYRSINHPELQVMVRHADGRPSAHAHRRTLTVVSRAPRPLYVNHPRTEPVPGDVVTRGDKDGAAWSYCLRPIDGGYRWRNTANEEWFAAEDFLDFGNGLRLLVDGETGRCVP